jgi:prefoldin alpha subunit
MSKKEDIQKKVIEFQILEANLKMLQERANVINQKAEELEKTRVAIEELKDTKPSKALIPLGSGNFVNGSIENSENIIVGIGSGVAIKKKREESIKILDDRIKDLENDLNDISKQSTAIIIQLEKVQQDIEKLQE